MPAMQDRLYLDSMGNTVAVDNMDVAEAAVDYVPDERREYVRDVRREHGPGPVD